VALGGRQWSRVAPHSGTHSGHAGRRAAANAATELIGNVGLHVFVLDVGSAPELERKTWSVPESSCFRPAAAMTPIVQSRCLQLSSCLNKFAARSDDSAAIASLLRSPGDATWPSFFHSLDITAKRVIVSLINCLRHPVLIKGSISRESTGSAPVASRKKRLSS
jgi:hypothetical protein